MHVAVTTTMSIYCFIVNFTSLQLFLDNPLIWPETAAALSWPWPLQSLNQDQLIHLKLIQLLPYLKIPKKQNFPNNKITVNIYLLTRDNCSWLEQLERSSVNIGKNWFFFLSFWQISFLPFLRYCSNTLSQSPTLTLRSPTKYQPRTLSTLLYMDDTLSHQDDPAKVNHTFRCNNYFNYWGYIFTVFFNLWFKFSVT